ncbi:OmpA family protein [Algoriphagus hitonicola]|uniref:Outer membrane protein OmpA n=1 Tax=Algoriphagus hitonicola TaxID=435880 RepID=A0A1I2P384_9BACT|nr:OmpA family protein [Algoriphagus hitonicola]SFG10665.1 Outer membrane protein OmpA [Algoriphagus hitonicola]
MKTSNRILLGLGIIGLLIGTPSCKTSNAVKGAAIGGSAGGILGGLIAGKDKTATGIIIGSAIGGSAGAIIGREMDKQAEELRRDLEGAKVERVGEGIKITFDSGLLFGFDQSTLSPEATTNLQNLATTLKKYEDTNIMIEGHTDSVGEEDYNLSLSRDRAYSVQSYLGNLGVSSPRMTSTGYGESMPLDSNETDMDRAQNRRVEVAIYANKKMQRMAKRGELGS